MAFQWGILKISSSGKWSHWQNEVKTHFISAIFPTESYHSSLIVKEKKEKKKKRKENKRQKEKKRKEKKKKEKKKEEKKSSDQFHHKHLPQ